MRETRSQDVETKNMEKMIYISHHCAFTSTTGIIILFLSRSQSNRILRFKPRQTITEFELYFSEMSDQKAEVVASYY